jgi:TRAP-type C4-dicarboxylate transport system permease small subunit
VTTAFALAFAQLNKSHISVGILMKHLPRPVRRLLDALTSLISCAFFALIGSETAQWAGYLVNTGELSETLRIAYHPFVFATAAGCLLMAFVLLVDTLKTVTGRTEH